MLTTHTIAGHTFTLESGRRYRASRPMADRFTQTYAVTITDLDTHQHANTTGLLSYDAANDLLTAFNNGDTSFAGRIWE